jgi:thioredoxin 1
MSDFVIEVNDSNFDAEVTNSAVPVLIDFWAPWCGPCRMVAPIVDELAKEMAGKVKFTKVNVDESPNTASRYGVMSIPTLLVIKGGQIVGQQVGAVPKPLLKSLIEKSL